MKNYKAKNVDEYIASSPKESRLKLEELRSVIKSTIPKVDEKISWGVPFYRYYGALVGFATFKNHVSFGLGSAGLRDNDRKRLLQRGYVTGKKIIQIKFDQKLPLTEIKQILKKQAETNETKRVAK